MKSTTEKYYYFSIYSIKFCHFLLFICNLWPQRPFWGIKSHFLLSKTIRNLLTQNIIIYKWKQEKSTSTIALKIYKSTTFYIFFLHSTRSFPPKFYIYKHPYFLQFYNIFLVFFYILHWFFEPNIQSTKKLTPPLQVTNT